ncbi:MAG: hypothetical protein AB7F78_22385, partial [Hyphomicrobiaceae bacterium]
MAARKTTASANPSTRAASLKQRLRAASGVQRTEEPAREAPAIVVTPGRAGKKPIAIYMQPLAKDQIMKLSHERKKTIQELGI